MGFWKRLTTFEPVQVRAVLTALATAALAFGLDISNVTDRVDTAWLALFAVVPIIQGWVTRPAVTPNVRADESVNYPMS